MRPPPPEAVSLHIRARPAVSVIATWVRRRDEMARTVQRLTPKQVSNAKPRVGDDSVLLADGGNLYLQCTRGKEGDVRRSWLFRYQLDGRRREMGLVALHTVGLAEARERARAVRQQLLDRIDPLDARE